MAAHLIQETEVIDVSALSMLIYGPPGVGKTHLAQTADDPITIDVDRGLHRVKNRKTGMRFDSARDLGDAAAEIIKRKTGIIDTTGRLLDLMAMDVIASNAKFGTAMGLSMQGWGALKARFAAFVTGIRMANRDLVFICHEKEEKDGDERIMRPDIQGGSYGEVMKFTDLVGYMNIDNQGRRWLDFNPSDRHLGKNAAGWERMEIPKDDRNFLSKLFADAKSRIGKTSESSAVAAKVVGDWEPKIAECYEPGDFDSIVSQAHSAKLEKAVAAQVWDMTVKAAAAKGYEWDKKNKQFKLKEGAAA